MKNSILKTILIISVIGLYSCKKEGSDTSYKQQISLRANGVLFSVTTGGTGVEEADAHIRDGNKFQLNGTTSIKDFSISNQNISATGTYNMTTGNILNFAQWEDGTALYSSIGLPKSHLTLNISKIAGNASDYVRYVEGTFSGVLYKSGQTDSINITEGKITIVE